MLRVKGYGLRVTGLGLSLILTLITCPLTLSFAKDINFEATADRNKAGIGQGIELSLTFYGTQNMPVEDLPETDNFRWRYLGPSTRMSIVNGQVSSSVTHIYELIPLKSGTFTIGPFKFDHGQDTYVSNLIPLEITEKAQDTYPQTQRQEDTLDLGRINERVFLMIAAAKNKAYLNETIPLNVKLYVNRLAIRDIQYPEFGHEGFSVSGFGQPKQYQETIGGIYYDVIEFNTAMFGLRPGEFRLGPANLKCNLVVRKSRQRQSSGFDDFFDADIFSDFFGRYENYPLSLKSADIPVTILALPDENKPDDFSGAIGNFSLGASVSPQEVKAGDPVTLKMAITGQGNFNTVTCPKLSSEENFKIYEPQISQEGLSQKAFEIVLIPLNGQIQEIPAVSYNFFDTLSGQYQRILKGPFPIKVTKPQKEEEQKIVESAALSKSSAAEESLGRDIIYIKLTPGKFIKRQGYLYKNRIFLWLQVLPFLAAVLVFFFRKRKARLKADLRYARKISASRKAKKAIRKAVACLSRKNTKEFYDALFQALQDYIGDRFHLPSKGITAGVIDDALKGMETSDEILSKLKDIFRDCDMARYSPSELSKKDMEEALEKLRQIIDYFQKLKYNHKSK